MRCGLILRFLGSLLLPLLLSTPVKATWNQQQLDAAVTQVQQDTLALMQHRGKLVTALDADEQAEIIALMRFTWRDNLANPAEVYRAIAERLYQDEQIAYYYAAAAQESNAAQAVVDLFYAYRAMLYADYSAHRFALERLTELSDDFDEKLYQRFQQLLESYRFSLSDIEVSHDQDTPEICLQFSNTIKDLPFQDWAKLISLTPSTLDNGTYRGDEICYRGDWRTTYTVHVDAGLSSDNDLTLDKNIERVIATGDRDAMLRFAAKGQTIIAHADAALTVESANIDTVEVNVWTIPVENLSNEMAVGLLNSRQSNYWWDSDDLERNARMLYHGEFDTEQRTANAVMASRLRLSDMGIHTPGIYVVTISDKDQGYLDETLAFSVAEVGFSAYLSEQGLWAELRDLRDFTPVEGAEVVLYARDNAILARGTTDAQGMVAFEQAAISGTGGATPDHLLYQDNQSLAYLYLDHQGFDLSDKGLDDRRSQASIQSWLWHDRGVYRPQDEMHALWLLRHERKPYHERDLWLTLRRPDGVIVHEQLISPDQSGAYRFDYAFPNTARLGNWQLTLALGKNATVIDQATIRVDAIQPQQIAAALTTLQQQPEINLMLQADWLYGAPGKHLLSDGWWKVQVRDWPQYHGWQIGRHDEELDEQRIYLNDQLTDDDGARDIAIPMAQLPKSTLPLAVAVQAAVHAPDGQAVAAQTLVPAKRTEPYVALRVADKQAQVALIDDDGNLQAQPLDWTLYRIYRDGYWYRVDGAWQYQYSETKTERAQGTLDTNPNAPALLDLPVDDGLWLLEVKGTQAHIAGSLRIEFGGGAANGDIASPEALTISANQPRYQNQEMVVLNIRAPFDGIGSVKLAHGDIFQTHTVEFKNHEATLTFPWQDNWAQGIWVLASAWQKTGDDTMLHNPRAVGLTWIGTALEPYALQPEITAPETITPNSDLTLTIAVPNIDEHGWVNVAIIDEGLYRLAPPSFSDPLLAFFGKTPWALSLFDIWGSIIRQSDAVLAKLRSGAGDDVFDAGLENLPSIDTPLITYWSTPVPVVNGKATVTMSVPQFYGTLRVMALAYDDERMGIAERAVTVSEDVISALYTPPFLTQGDVASMNIRLHNTSDEVQSVTVGLEATGLHFSPRNEEITLQPDEEYWIKQPFVVRDHDKAQIAAIINGASIERTIDIRPMARSVLQHRYLTLASGESLDVPLGSAYAVGGLGLNQQQINADLNSYPYYCSEQTASRLVGALAPQYGRSEAVVNTQARLANLQNRDGGFALWSGQDADAWLSAYVGDVLLRAKEHGDLTQTQPLDRLLAYLREHVIATDRESGLGYSYYVLAKAGVNMQGAAIRYAEGWDEPTFNSDGLEMVLALYLYGEDERADQLWQRLDGEGRLVSYQSVLSELAQRLYRLYELRHYRDVSMHITQTQRALQAELDGAYSTQELAWLAMLANEEAINTVVINGERKTVATLAGIAREPTHLTNESDHDLAVTISKLHAGKPDALIEQGYRIEFSYKNYDGLPLDMQHLPLHQDVLVDVTIHRDENIADRTADIMFVYPYSAGEQGIAWVANDDYDLPAYQENRDDRHIAAFSLQEGETILKHQFSLRSIREGMWRAPGAAIEDMYRSDYKAQYPVRKQRIDANLSGFTALESLR